MPGTQECDSALHERASRPVRHPALRVGLLAVVALAAAIASSVAIEGAAAEDAADKHHGDRRALVDLQRSFREGKRIFRYDTFGDEAFWGDALKLHQAVQGERFGGVGSGLSPKMALALGLKVDVGALPGSLQSDLKRGRVNLDDPAVTLTLLKLDAG